MGSKEFGPEQDYPPISPPSGKPFLLRSDGQPATFLDLLDTINSYSGHAGKFLMVKLTEDGVTVSAVSVETDKNYVHNQPTPSDDWGTINHAMGKYPTINIFDDSGNEAHADISHVDINNVTITSTIAFAGTAYFN